MQHGNHTPKAAGNPTPYYIYTLKGKAEGVE